ncbi:MAG TPA: GntR family transcriptional regulator [Trebonia sp.]
MVVQHRQIADDLRKQIAASVYPLGSCLPPEAEMAAQYGVSRGTVRQAVITLQVEGLLDTRQGARRTVLRAAPAQSLSELQSFAQWALGLGHTPGGLILHLEYRPATPEQAAALAVPAGEKLLHVRRLRTLNGGPILVERTAYTRQVADAVAALPRDTPSVTEALREASGTAYGHGRHVIDAVAAGVTDAALLSIRRGSPMLRHRYVISTPDGCPFLSSDDRYKPGTMAITLDNDVTAAGITRKAAAGL